MGEFPEPAIRGSTVAESAPAPTTSTSPSQPIQATDPSPSADSSSQSETKTSTTPSSTPVTSKTASSFSRASSTRMPSSTTMESQTPVQSTTPTTTTTTTTTSIQPTSTTQQTTTSMPQPTSSQVITPASVAITPAPTTLQRSSTLVSSIIEISTSSETPSLTEIVTRPIITPTPSQPPPLATTAPTANSHLSFGAIMGIVGVVAVILAVAGVCVVLGPRRTLRKVGIGANRDDEKLDYEEWEQAHRESGTWNGRPASVGASSDWWRPPAGAFPTRPSTVSMGGPGMAGVGAGRGMEMDSSTSPIPRRMSQRRVEERGAVRSGWFAASMVRGASLLSLGSLVRPPADSNGRGSQRMSRMGTGGSAGKRFQELYRRERASGTIPARSNEPTEYLATVSELGEHKPNGATPGEMGGYRPRSMAPRIRRPSRLATSYVPEIVVHDATLPNLSSVSSVTHESGGRGYDADAEAERRPRVL
ncbi:unnamed protein product [Rhizoctonia solani]|uniref:Transmembrane protein n=1 Tax=Rhizoctonia solani TaxID=456999 RepID=A0A8H3HU98_9AGAM|nr:unnamed protein product [Rhizoctonia solani]